MNAISPASDSFAFDQSEVRLLASVKYWALKASSEKSVLPNRQSLKNIFRDSSDIVDEDRYRKLKTEWCEQWKRTTCDLLELGELINEDKLHEALNKANLHNTKTAAFCVEAATWAPFHEFKEGDTRYQKLRTDDIDFNNYCKYICNLPVLRKFSAVTLKSMRDDYESCTKKIVKTINGENYTWIWVGAGALALLLVAPYAAGMIGGMMGLTGAAATSAGLAFLGGGSLAAGGMGMTGGYVVLMAGGALMGYGGGSKQYRERFAETSKEEILVNCSKLHAMRDHLGITPEEVCKNLHAMQIDFDTLADNSYCQGKTSDGKDQSSKAIVLATYRRIARGELNT